MRKAFTLIELLIVMAVMAILLSIATVPFYSSIKSNIYKTAESDLVGSSNLDIKILKNNAKIDDIDFTSTSPTDYYTDTINGVDYKYVIFSRLHLTQVRIFDSNTHNYTQYGIIIDTSNYHDNNGNTLLSKPCYVYNSETDSQPYWTTQCTPNALNWNYQ